MKKCLLIIIIFLTVRVYAEGAIPDSLSLQAKELITTVQKKYAPDKRTRIFETHVIGDSSILEVETTEPEAVEALKSSFGKVGVPFRIRSGILPSKDLGNKIYGVANLSVCNNRKLPDNAAEMVTQMILGTPVDVLKKEHGYYLVRTPDSYISWVDSYGVSLMDEAAFKKWQQADKIVFIAVYGHSFSKPGKKSGIVSDLVAGNILELKGKKKKFYEVAYPDGRIAYIPEKDAALYKKWVSRPDPKAEQILETARTLTGIPYLWGGTSIKGVDCSGFTKTSYFLNGIVLPRDASQQALVGEKVDIYENDTVSLAKCLKNLRAGDLLFFAGGRNRSLNSRVTHTAIYIGNGEFIQAAGLVRVGSMVKGSKNYDDYQSRTLVSARRMLTAIGSPGVTRIDHSPFYSLK